MDSLTVFQAASRENQRSKARRSNDQGRQRTRAGTAERVAELPKTATGEIKKFVLHSAITA